MPLQLHEDRPVTTPLPLPTGVTKTIEAHLNDADLSGLSDYDVKVRIRNLSTDEQHQEQAATVEDEGADLVSYKLDQFELAEAATYGVRFIVLDNIADTETKYPGDGYYRLHVTGPTREESLTQFQEALNASKSAQASKEDAEAAADDANTALGAIKSTLDGGIVFVTDKNDDVVKMLVFQPSTVEDGQVNAYVNGIEYQFETARLTTA